MDRSPEDPGEFFGADFRMTVGVTGMPSFCLWRTHLDPELKRQIDERFGTEEAARENAPKVLPFIILLLAGRS